MSRKYHRERITLRLTCSVDYVPSTLTLLVAGGADLSIPQGFREYLKQEQLEPSKVLTFLKTVSGRYPENLRLLACTGADPGPCIWEILTRNCILVAQIVKFMADNIL